MKIQIFHAKEPNFGFGSIRPFPVWPDGFTHVADLELPFQDVMIALETAYQLTNHIDSPWHKSELPNINCLVDKPRSTSVGDMAVVNGVRYLCDSCGWLTMEKAPDDA